MEKFSALNELNSWLSYSHQRQPFIIQLFLVLFVHLNICIYVRSIVSVFELKLKSWLPCLLIFHRLEQKTPYLANSVHEWVIVLAEKITLLGCLPFTPPPLGSIDH